jgi:hypothetical protein
MTPNRSTGRFAASREVGGTIAACRWAVVPATDAAYAEVLTDLNSIQLGITKEPGQAH